MAINSGRLVIQTAYREGVDRLSTPTPTSSRIAFIAPPSSYVDRDGVTQTQLAEYEGQVAMVETSDRFICNMYVVVNTGTPESPILEWKRCNIYTYLIDSRTGNPYDPLADFYNVLAT